MALSLLRKVLVTWLFGLLRVRMARPLRGHAWPVGCASTSKFIITAIQNCLIGSSSQEICEHVSLCQHHLLPPASTPSWPQTCAMGWGSHSWSDAFSSGESAVVRAGGPSPLSRLSAPLSGRLHTPHPMPLCACYTHPWGCLCVSTSSVSCEGVPRVSHESVEQSAREELKGQSELHVWPILLWAGQPHFISAFNLGGHKCNFILFPMGTPKTMRPITLKEHVYKHACIIIFIILYDDKGEHKKPPHRLCGIHS